MKFTISDCISRINQALNYPAISYEDVSHFFDQAITELNTSLRVSIPTVTEMRLENTFKIAEGPNTILVNPSPLETKLPILVVDKAPTETPDSLTWPIAYYRAPSPLNRKFYIYKNGACTPVNKAYGVDRLGRCFETIALDGYAVWREVQPEHVTEFSLTDYLTTDWIILFLIPYVCFKFAVRNGDNGALFSDEFTQGFQQLQTSYNVPNNVALNTVAHRPAYKHLVEANLHNLSRVVQVRAIYDDMKVPNGIHTVHGEGIFDNGGWGL